MRTSATGRPDGPPRYEIRLEGTLDPRWATSFDGLSLRNGPDGTTVLRGPVVDQVALHGVLQRVRDVLRLGVPALAEPRRSSRPCASAPSCTAPAWSRASCRPSG